MRANVVLSDGMNNEISKETVARKTETLERQRESEGETEREAERERGRGRERARERLAPLFLRWVLLDSHVVGGDEAVGG